MTNSIGCNQECELYKKIYDFIIKKYDFIDKTEILSLKCTCGFLESEFHREMIQYNIAQFQQYVKNNIKNDKIDYELSSIITIKNNKNIKDEYLICVVMIEDEKKYMCIRINNDIRELL